MLQHGLHSWKVQNDALGDKITAVSIPKGKSRRAVFASSEGTLIYKGTKNPDAAWEFAKFMGEEQQAKEFVIRRGAGPTLKSVGADPIFKENRFYKAAMDSRPGLDVAARLASQLAQVPRHVRPDVPAGAEGRDHRHEDARGSRQDPPRQVALYQVS